MNLHTTVKLNLFAVKVPADVVIPNKSNIMWNRFAYQFKV